MRSRAAPSIVLVACRDTQDPKSGDRLRYKPEFDIHNRQKLLEILNKHPDGLGAHRLLDCYLPRNKVCALPTLLCFAIGAIMRTTTMSLRR